LEKRDLVAAETQDPKGLKVSKDQRVTKVLQALVLAVLPDQSEQRVSEESLARMAPRVMQVHLELKELLVKVASKVIGAIQVRWVELGCVALQVTKVCKESKAIQVTLVHRVRRVMLDCVVHVVMLAQLEKVERLENKECADPSVVLVAVVLKATLVKLGQKVQ
jgi:hypothetical protein